MRVAVVGGEDAEAIELGDYDRAARRLLTIATNTGRPICVNVPTPEGSTTMFIVPKGWSGEWLRGWAAGHHAELEAAVGPATVRPMEDA